MAGPTMARRGPLGRVLPIVYLVAAAVLVVVVLPTSLRPPQDAQTSSAEFSPDVPPEDPPEEQIISSFTQAQSSTAGATDAPPVPGEEGEPLPVDGGPAIDESPPLASCRFGFGDPPRQTESVYSAPCAPAFQGDNGGATYPFGVDGTEFRVAVGVLAGNVTVTEGPVPDSPRPGENGADRTFRLFQAYFNERYEFYGRRMRLYVDIVDRTPEQSRASARDVISRFDPFAATVVSGSGPSWLDEMVRQERVIMKTGEGVPLPGSWYDERAPFAFSFDPDSRNIARMTAEYVCKKLDGKPAIHAGDGIDRTAPRVFGYLYYGGGDWTDNGQEMEKALADACGLEPVETVSYNLDGASSTAYATAMARFAQKGVTTVIMLADAVTVAPFLNAATQARFYPEWFVTGAGGPEQNFWARTFNPDQWRHAFGINFQEVPRPEEETDPFRAYSAMDPDRSPSGPGVDAYWALLQIANGVQRAGPTLTAETFGDGLFSLGRRAPTPIWSIGGGFSPQDRTFHDYVSEIWWDPTAVDPTEGQPGAYRHVAGGRRFTYGEVPREDPILFDPAYATPGPAQS